MPQTNEGILLVVGAIFLLIGLLGGGIEIAAARIPSVGKYPRIFSVGIGVILMGIALTRLVFPSLPPQPTAAPTVVETPTSISPSITVMSPTATIDTDPTMYDNFNNPAFDGKVDTNLWRPSVTSPSYIEQREGVLVSSLESKAGEIASLFLPEI